MHVHGWYLKVFLTYADQLEVHNEEVKGSLVVKNVTFLVLFYCALY